MGAFDFGLRRRICALAVALVAALCCCVLCVGGVQQAWADDAVDLGAPAHSKYLGAEQNEDGSWNLTLSVTGESQSVSSKTKANVVVVLDTSGSMKNYEKVSESYAGAKYGKVHRGEYVELTSENGKYYYRGDHGGDVEYTGDLYASRLDVAKLAVNGLAENLLKLNEKSPGTVQMALIAFSSAAENPYVTTGYSDFSKKVEALQADGGTNWEDALEEANAVSFGDNDPTYVIFVSDGNPTYRNTQGDYNEPDDDYYTGLLPFFNSWKPSAPHGTGSEEEPTLTRCYDHAKDDAKKIVDEEKSFYGVGTFGNVTKMRSLVGYAYTGRDSADEAPADRYFDAINQAGLEEAFAAIAEAITKDYTYTSVKVTDKISSYVDVVPGSFAYKKGTEEWVGAPGASYTEPVKDESGEITAPGEVVWDLGNTVLDKGVTYSVTFKVKPNQKAYDAVAAVANGGSDSNVVAGNNGYSVYTNKEAMLAYSQLEAGSDGGTSSVQKESVPYLEEPSVPVPVSTLTIKKEWEGASAPVDYISVQVKQDGEDYKTVSLAEGNNWTQALTVPAGPDGHTYAVEETTDLGNGWTKSYSSESGVELKGESAQTGAITVTNAYKPAKVTALINVAKELTGRNWRDGDSFEFTLVGKGAAPMPAGAAGDVVTIGNSTEGYTAAFGSITYEEAGEYSYTISEKNTGLGGITYAASQDVTVSVVDKDGQLKASVDYPAGYSAFLFTNVYGAERVTVGASELVVTKELVGRDWKDGDSFEFTLVGEAGAPMPTTGSTVTIGNSTEGYTAAFGSITYDTVGTYVYEITEVAGDIPGVSYDGHRCTVTVNVVDNQEGELVASVSRSGSMTFTNTYSVKPIESSLTGDGKVSIEKVLTGRDLVAGEFEFQLKSADGAVVAKGANDASGSVLMSSVKFEKPGTYVYTLSEVEGDAARVSYDPAEYVVTAKVSDNGDGTMSVAWTVAGEDDTPLEKVVFKNAYEPEVVPPATPVVPEPDDDGDEDADASDEPASSDDGKQVLAKTGDSAPALLLTAVAGAAVLVLVALAAMRRRSRR